MRPLIKKLNVLIIAIEAPPFYTCIERKYPIQDADCRKLEDG